MAAHEMHMGCVCHPPEGFSGRNARLHSAAIPFWPGISLIYYFFTRTDWDEPPRIRHQLARMLLREGHEVIFFDGSRRSGSFDSHSPEVGLTCVRTREILHHQLRPLAALQRLSGAYAKSQIELTIKRLSLPSPDVVVNFNYDYDFLRSLFPDQRLILFLNDDFVGMAKKWMRREAVRVEARCARESGTVLTVSSAIAKRYEGEVGMTTELFLPWAESEYVAPADTGPRNTVLYFGYINSRNDWPMVQELVESSTMNFRFVGEVEDSASKEAMEKITRHANVEQLPPMAFDQIPLEDVCCSIAPYDASVDGAAAITLNNRSLRLLSRGIPSVITEMPYLLPAASKVVRPALGAAGFSEAIDVFGRDFYAVQSDIAAFVASNSERARFDQLVAQSEDRGSIEKAEGN